ncbi:MAG: MlaE family ABC transporter permease [Alphaproteobacteria bacterium]
MNLQYNSAALPQEVEAGFEPRGDDGIVLTGHWAGLLHLGLFQQLEKLLQEKSDKKLTVELSENFVVSPNAALILLLMINRLKALGKELDIEPSQPAQQQMIDLAANGIEAAPVVKVAGEKFSLKQHIMSMVEQVGLKCLEFFAEAKSMTSFLGDILLSLWAIVRLQSRFRFTAFLYHCHESAVKALPILTILAFLMGVVLTFQAAEQLRKFGAELLVVNLLGVSVFREIGVLITAIILAGRTGAAYAAEIGTMRVNQETDAMNVMGISVTEVLVIPRIAAMVLAMPLLFFYVSIIALLGGMLLSNALLDIQPAQFLLQFKQGVGLNHFWAGLIKAPVFALVIALVGCYQGLSATGSAESVGRRTTFAVVQAIFMVLALDAVFSILFNTIGL